ncbi:MAG TPA: pesticin C-terminus-like muramidase [Pyrinomonadaceae bacterium]|nr:pesticin C-terminus-like muramidase [Pyrinomonadaceae bacterium]
MEPLSPKAFDLITNAEGLDQPGEFPGGESGVTIGIGYDLGFVTAQELQTDWGTHLSAAVIARLKTAIGLTGPAAKNKAHDFKDIHITRADALAVFRASTIPETQRTTARAFPGIDQLPADAQGALVSLIYNRGPKMDGERRIEMRAIRDAVASTTLSLTAKLREIAAQLRAMKRLWIGKGLDGLIKRREDEARLIESTIPH